MGIHRFQPPGASSIPKDTGQARLLIGVSACLLGEPVRYDGAHRLDPYVCDALARQFRLVSVCPEVGLGLGVPRRPIRLVLAERGVRVRDSQEPDNPLLDITEGFPLLADRLAPLLARLSGYIFKSGSPSCGLRDVTLYEGAGSRRSDAIGAFAQLVMDRYPQLPLIDERELADPRRRSRFVQRVLASEVQEVAASVLGEDGGP